MAYVRTHGNQVSIVHGARHPETGKVEQQVLFTFYSKAEVLEAIGRGGEGGERLFLYLIQLEHPYIEFDWEKLKTELEVRLEALPDIYPHHRTRLQERFRADLIGFARQLMLLDPQSLLSSAELVRAQRQELEFVAELIRWRLSQCEQGENEWNRDNPYLWRLRLRGSAVSIDDAVDIHELYERGELEQVRALANLLIECFPDYADGHRYLGLVALAQSQYADADAHFRRTMEVGRTLFPKRLPKKFYGSHHPTRPYLRGFNGLILTLNRRGDYDAALDLARRLEVECGQVDAATGHRMVIWLNAGNWARARVAALRDTAIHPEHAFPAAYASYELGEEEEALYWFVYGALHRPRTAQLLLGKRINQPAGWEQVTDHNAGIDLLADINGYIRKQTASARSFFGQAMADPQIAAMVKDRSRNHHGAIDEGRIGGRPEHEVNEGFIRAKAKELLAQQGLKSEKRAANRRSNHIPPPAIPEP